MLLCPDSKHGGIELVPLMLQFLLAIIIAAATGILFSVFSLTPKIRQTVLANCRYKGGEWSAHRARREMRSYLRYYSDLIVPCVLTVPAMFVALQYLNDQIPINTAIRSIQSFDLDQQTWRDNLQEIRIEHAQSLRKNRGLSEDHIAGIQHDLWYRWPLMVLTLACLTAAAISLVMGGAKHAVIEYVQGIRRRRDYYHLRDIKWSAEGRAQNSTKSVSNQHASGLS